MNIIDANKAYTKKCHQPLSTLVGQKCYAAAYRFDSPCNRKEDHACPLEETLSNKKNHSRIHHFWIKDHAVVEEITTTPIIEDNGEIKYIVEEFRDITKLLGLKKGIISTCSYCKKIRDEDGQWINFDVYLHKHTGADFSHGICEECHEHILKNLEHKTPYSH